MVGKRCLSGTDQRGPMTRSMVRPGKQIDLCSMMICAYRATVNPIAPHHQLAAVKLPGRGEGLLQFRTTRGRVHAWMVAGPGRRD